MPRKPRSAAQPRAHCTQSLPDPPCPDDPEAVQAAKLHRRAEAAQQRALDRLHAQPIDRQAVKPIVDDLVEAFRCREELFRLVNNSVMANAAWSLDFARESIANNVNRGKGPRERRLRAAKRNHFIGKAIEVGIGRRAEAPTAKLNWDDIYRFMRNEHYELMLVGGKEIKPLQMKRSYLESRKA
jgi:hypothetical protein